MKAQLVLAGLCLSFLLASSASAGNIPPLAFDENGNGAFGPGVLAPDPGPGGLGAVLTYRLPFAGVPGDVLLHDGALTAPFLDVLRFNGNGTLVFYSDNTDGFDALADTASPPAALYPNQVHLLEIGPEGNNGAFYSPGPNDPGFDPSFPTYHFISDGSVPEPASLSLLSIGVVAGAFVSWRRRRI